MGGTGRPSPCTKHVLNKTSVACWFLALTDMNQDARENPDRPGMSLAPCGLGDPPVPARRSVEKQGAGSGQEGTF